MNAWELAAATPDAQVDRCRGAFREAFGGGPEIVAIAPGRINIVGEHTDYNNGLALPAAIDRWLVVALRRSGNRRVRVRSVDFDGLASWQIEEITDRARTAASTADHVRVATSSARHGDVAPSTAGQARGTTASDEPAAAARAGDEPAWAAFVAGCMAAFSGERRLESGLDVCIAGDVPIGAGVSSSAAVEVALMLALRAAFAAPLGDLEIVRLCQRFEHHCLGVESGILDQYTAVFARPGAALLVDFRDVSHRVVAAEMADLRWVLADSKRQRQLADTDYTERVHEMARALQHLRDADTGVTHFRDIEPQHLGLLEDETLGLRMRHYIGENERVERAARLLAEADLEALGELLLASHASLRDDYEVSCAELDALVEFAMDAEGCVGARMMGGGFGGATINLVHTEAIESFTATVSGAYRDRFGLDPDVRAYRLVGGARLV